jgi:hypothetical protein
MWRLPCGLRRRIGIRVRRWSAIRYGSRLGRRISLTIRWVWRIRRIGRVGWIRRRRSCATRRSSGKRLVRAIRCLASGRLSRCRRRSGWLRQWRWRSGLCRWWRGWRRRSRPHRWSRTARLFRRAVQLRPAHRTPWIIRARGGAAMRADCSIQDGNILSRCSHSVRQHAMGYSVCRAALSIPESAPVNTSAGKSCRG